MDEVGRGTTVEDGLAIAFATVHHLVSVNGCRAMFATHFHELADMLGHDSQNHTGVGAFSKVAFFCTDVDEIEVSFVHGGSEDYSDWTIERLLHLLSPSRARREPRQPRTEGRTAGWHARLGHRRGTLGPSMAEETFGRKRYQQP